MNDDSILGNSLGQLGGVIKQTAQQAVKIPKGFVEDVSEQVGVKTEAPVQDNKAPQPSTSSDKDTEEFVKGLYAKSGPVAEPSPEASTAAKAMADKTAGQANLGEMNSDEKKIVDEEFEKQIAGKTPEEQKKLRELRHQLHAQYYQKLVNPPKQQEERPAEKMEKEKMQEMQELEQKEAKKPAPLAVSMAREKTEKFPGASG